MSDVSFFHRRTWLNSEEHGGIAFLNGEIETYSEDRAAYGDFTMSDCNRMVTLSFDLHDEEGRANSLEKIRKLIDFSMEYERALLKASAYSEEVERKEKEKEGRKKKVASRRRTR